MPFMCHLNLMGENRMSNGVDGNLIDSLQHSMDSNKIDDSNINDCEVGEWYNEEINKFRNFQFI